MVSDTSGGGDPGDNAYLLSNLRVLDIATFIAGPAAATVLGDFGAEVIKIEAPGEGDPHRLLGQAHSIPQHPVNFCWHMDSRNKKSIALNLKDPRAPDLEIAVGR